MRAGGTRRSSLEDQALEIFREEKEQRGSFIQKRRSNQAIIENRGGDSINFLERSIFPTFCGGNRVSVPSPDFPNTQPEM
jgi:hypothetical protein